MYSKSSLNMHVTNNTDFVNGTIAESANFWQIPVNILLCIIVVVGILGNISVCVVIVKNKDMRTACNYYLFSLAISDSLVIIFSLIVLILKIFLQGDVTKGYLCVTRKLASRTGHFAALLTIIAFSVERYIAVCHPFTLYKINKLSRTIKVIIAYWIVAFCLALPHAFCPVCYTACFSNVDENITPVIDAYQLYTQLVAFIVYFATMIPVAVLYLLIGLRLRKSHKLSPTSSVDQWKIIKVLAAVVITLIICWTPLHIFRFYIYFLADREKVKLEGIPFNYYTIKIIYGLYYIVPTTINPLLYNIMSRKFRDSFKKTFLCKSEKQESQPATANIEISNSAERPNITG